jgi:hypothetical protein
MHLCRGNSRSHWYAAGGYVSMAEKLFGGLKVDRVLLEYDDERSGIFGPLRFVPKENLTLSPHCRFASAAEGNLHSEGGL